MSVDEAPSTSAKNAEVVKDVLTVLAPVTLISGLLYYFGFVRERAFWSYFGVDLDSVGFATQDYLVRSPGTFFLPVARLLGIVVFGILIHHVILIALPRIGGRYVERAIVVAAFVSLACLSFGLLSVTQVLLPLPLWGPMLIVLGAVLLEYSAVVASSQIPSHPISRQISGRSGARIRRSAVLSLILVGLFAATAQLAHDQGRETAESAARALRDGNRIVVYSRFRLQLSGSLVKEVPLNRDDAAFAYRYDGLRLLSHSGGHWIVVPSGWTPESGDKVVMLRDSDPDIRVDQGN